MNDIRKYKVLTHTEQKNLVYRAQNGKTEAERQSAINELICSNQRFVVSVAKKLANNNNLMDLINEGNIGLLDAIQRFDLTKNFHFITYAVYWVKKQMIEYLANKDTAVRPANMVKLYNFSKKAREDFLIQYQRQPTLEELQNFLFEKYNFRVPDTRDLETFQSISLSSEMADGENSTFEDSAAFSNVTSSNNVEENVDKNDNKAIVAYLLSELPERDAAILRSAFGIDCDKKTCDTIAFETKLSRERVRQIINISLKKLKINNKYLMV